MAACPVGTKLPVTVSSPIVTTSSYSWHLSLLQRSDPQLLAQFYYADEELNQVAAELDSLDGRKEPQRCTLLVSQFRSCQVSKEGRVLGYVSSWGVFRGDSCLGNCNQGGCCDLSLVSCFFTT